MIIVMFNGRSYIPCVKVIDCQYAIIFLCRDTATTDIYTLSLHDALPISLRARIETGSDALQRALGQHLGDSVTLHLDRHAFGKRSEEHTSELQSRENLVCRLLLEKKKNM